MLQETKVLGGGHINLLLHNSRLMATEAGTRALISQITRNFGLMREVVL